MGVADVMSLLGALALIVLMLVLTYYATRWYARRMGGSFGAGRHIKVIDRVQVGTGSALILVEIASRYYLIGVGDKNAGLICELSDFDPHDGDSVPGKPGFSQILRDMMQKTREKDDHGNHGGAT